MTIKVVCAIIIQNNKVLVAKRSTKMLHPGYWEFPGGKIELGESEHECLHREIHEELDCEIIIKNELKNYEYKYPNKTINIKPFICILKNKLPSPIEHEKINWFTIMELNYLQWLPSDIKIKNFLSINYSNYFHL